MTVDHVRLRDHDQAVILAVKGSHGKRDHQSTGRALSYGKTHELLAKCDRTSIKGLRDALIISLGAESGLRRTEIARLKLSDLNLADRSICIIGKGNKRRNVSIRPMQCGRYSPNGSPFAAKKECQMSFASCARARTLTSLRRSPETASIRSCAGAARRRASRTSRRTRCAAPLRRACSRTVRPSTSSGRPWDTAQS